MSTEGDEQGKKITANTVALKIRVSRKIFWFAEKKKKNDFNYYWFRFL